MTDETTRRARLGWNSDAAEFTLPVYEAGELVNLRRRRGLGSGEPFRGLYRRGSQLYPDVPQSRGVLLVAGEFDALIGRQYGLPTVTTTCGARLPDCLVPPLVRRRVYVMYDVGEDEAAARTKATLIAAGGLAFVVPLVRLGAELGTGADLSDVLLAGYSRADIHRLVRTRAS